MTWKILVNRKDGLKEKEMISRRNSCRGCFSKKIFCFLDFGRVPLAGGFLSPEEIKKEKKFPLKVYYCKDCNEMMVSVQAPKKCTKCHKSNLRQDEDTLDTWFSSGLWTFSTLGWPKQTEDLKRFHPTSVMETGYDILFFWVARMILMTTYALNEIPFKTVYLRGLVRTKTGEKMSKSKPETCIDPLDMIQKYGADALRLSLVIGSSPGNDIRLYEEKIAGYRNFVNKIWNSARFVLMNIEEKDYNANEKESTSVITESVVLDEVSESVEKNSSLKDLAFEGNVRITVERHLHNFIQDGELKKIVLRHWIPLKGGKIEFDYQSRLQLANFLELASSSPEVVCFDRYRRG